MPDSVGKRKRRDVTARKHAAREERRVARAGRKKDREAGLIEPGPAYANGYKPDVCQSTGEPFHPFRFARQGRDVLMPYA